VELGCGDGTEAGRACPKPGKSNDKGEKLFDALMPPQPAVNSASADNTAASRNGFHSRFTRANYKSG
jgi:hypothetical protein